MGEKIGEIRDKMREEALRDFLYEIAYKNINTEIGKKLYDMLEGLK